MSVRKEHLSPAGSVLDPRPGLHPCGDLGAREDDPRLGPDGLERRAQADRRRRPGPADGAGARATCAPRSTAAGATPADVVIVRVFVVNYRQEHAAVIGPALDKFFAGSPAPASTWLGVQALAAPGLPDRDRGDGGGRRMSRAGLRAALAAALLLAGCKLLELRRNLETLDEIELIGGHVSHADPQGAPIIVVLVAGRRLAGARRVRARGARRVLLRAAAGPLPGRRVRGPQPRLHLPARRRAGELVRRAGPRSTPPRAAASATSTCGCRASAERPLGVAIAASPTGRRGSAVLPPIAAGDVVGLDDPRFDSKNGQLGLWRPVDFMFKVESGFYFLEKYDPAQDSGPVRARRGRHAARLRVSDRAPRPEEVPALGAVLPDRSRAGPESRPAPRAG